MVTYGDMMSILLTFFVLILSFSSIQNVEFEKALGSLKSALGVLPKKESVIYQLTPKFPKIANNLTKGKFQKSVQELQKIIKEEGLEDNIKLETKEDGILIRIDSPVLFDLGKAKLKAKALPILNRVLEMTRDWPNNIRIEGHTDDLPIHTEKYPSNWELSTARALSVLRYFLNQGNVEPNRLAAVGYGEYHPLVPNNSQENRAKNRRVEIYIDAKKHQTNLNDDISDIGRNSWMRTPTVN